MRPVRSEQHAVRSDEIADVRHVVFVERRDPHVIVKRVERIALVQLRGLAVRTLQTSTEVTHPTGTQFDGGDLQTGDPIEQTVADQGCDEVVDRSFDVHAHHFAEGRHLVSGVLGSLAPHLRVNAVTRVRAVERHDDARIGHRVPELVVHRIGERMKTVGGVHRRRSEGDEACTLVQNDLQLLECAHRIDQ